MSDKLKYLGIVFSHNLKCDRHLTYLETRNEKLVRVINALTGNLTMKSKMVIYKQEYLTSILYGHEIWAPALTGRLRDQLA